MCNGAIVPALRNFDKFAQEIRDMKVTIGEMESLQN